MPAAPGGGPPAPDRLRYRMAVDAGLRHAVRVAEEALGDELRALVSYLPCGMLSEGFARVKCRDCGDELIVGLT